MRIVRTVTTALALSMSLTLALGSLASAKGNPCNPCNPCQMKGKKKGQKFVIGDPKNSATFTSEAPLEEIVGTSNKLSGYIMFNPCNPQVGGSGKLSIPVASLNTGIPMRDKHLVSPDWLDAKAYPDITFTINMLMNLKEISKKKGSMTFEGGAMGEFSMHGKSRKMTVPVRFTFLKASDMTRMQAPGNLLVGRASFEVALKDFDVPSAQYRKIIGAKVGKTVTVAVSFFGTDSPQHSSGNPCNPCNPCGDKKAMNPCNPCNPCGG